MTLDEFKNPMERLRRTFGAEKNYPDERVESFFYELKDSDGQLWAAAVNRLILEEKYPPMMKEIRIAIAVERDNRYEREKLNRAKGLDDWNECSPFPEELRRRFPKLVRAMPTGEGEA